MAATLLDLPALSRRLGELAGHEREVQVEFLLCLAAFDDRRGWAEAGYGSLWDYLLRVLHLREGAAGRRIAAMKVLRRWPVLAGALREGRLCLSTAALLGPLLTDENLDELVARAAYLTKAEVERLVVTMQPKVGPREGVRLVTRAAAPRALPVAPAPLPAGGGEGETGGFRHPAPTSRAHSTLSPGNVPRPTMTPVDGDTYSLRVTVDSGFKADLEQLRSLLAHQIPSGDLAAVLREAVRCAIEKHGKRKGAVAPARKAPPPQVAPAKKTAGARERIPAAIRRQVWRRDEGRCAWRGPDGRRCGSSWKLELDHVVPAALGGPSTVENVRLCCRAHNQLHAERVFGRAHMESFRRGTGTRTGELTISSDSDAPGESAAPAGPALPLTAPARTA